MRNFLLFPVKTDAIGRSICRKEYWELQRGICTLPTFALKPGFGRHRLFGLCFKKSRKLGVVTSGPAPSTNLLDPRPAEVHLNFPKALDTIIKRNMLGP